MNWGRGDGSLETWSLYTLKIATAPRDLDSRDLRCRVSSLPIASSTAHNLFTSIRRQSWH